MTERREIDLCGINHDGQDNTNQLIFSSLYLGFTTFVFSFLMTKLFKNLQMFPIKEKSGKLILMFVLFNYLFLISYPVLLIVNIYKEQSDLTQNWISVLLRFLYNFYVVTYFMRALRIHYAYDVSQKLEGIMYEIIKNENILCLITFLMGATLSLPPQYILPYLENIYDTTDPKNEDFKENYRIQSLIVVLINQLILLFSLFLIRRAKTTFNIQTELVCAIILEFSFSLTKRCFGIIVRSYDLNPRCCNGFPSYYAFDSLKIIALVSLTVVVPLLQVKKNPQRSPYSIIADNFELFLSEPLCIDIFHNYLLYYDNKVKQIHQQKSSKYSYCLQFQEN